MVRGRFAVPMQTSSISLLNRYSNKNYISLDSQRIMLYHDIHYVDVKKYAQDENLKKSNFQQYFFKFEYFSH